VTPDSSAPSAAQQTLPVEEFSIDELWGAFARRWRLALMAPVIGALIGAGAATLWPKTWKATTSFVPEQALGSSTGGLLGAIGGLGSLLGDAGGSAGALAKLKDGPSTDFFADVLTSSELLSATLRAPFKDPRAPGETKPLIDLIDVTGATPERRFGNGMRKLKRKVAVVVGRKSGIVSLDVSLRDPELAAAVANRMLALLNDFNLQRRQRSSTAQRRFSETRLSTAKTELAQAEEAKQTFLDANRNYYESSRLMAEYDRLDRALRVKESILLSLTTTLEESRVAEVRDTPLLTIVDMATVPDRPAQRPLPWGAVAAAASLTIALMYVMIAAILDRRRPSRAALLRPVDLPMRAVS
jgi:uncharacterized protein involved in exopolysaccharide biosynthesis